MLKFVTRFLIALFFGVIVSIWIAQNNMQVQKSLITSLLTLLEKEWDSTITVESHKTNFFTCSLFLNKGQVSCRHRSCAWQFNNAKVQISLLDLVFKQKISLYLTFNDVDATTEYKDGHFEINHHIVDIFRTKSGSVSISPQEIKINALRTTAQVHGKNIEVIIPGSAEMKKNQLTGGWVGNLKPKNGALILNNQALITDTSGIINFVQKSADAPWTVSIDTNLNYTPLNKKTTFALKGNWDSEIRKIILTNADQNLDLAIESSDQGPTIKGCTPIALISNLYKSLQSKPDLQQESTSAINGTADINLCFNDAMHITGSAQLKNLNYKKISLGICDLNNIQVSEQTIKTNLALKVSSRTKFTGSIDWDKTTNQGTVLLTNATSLAPFTHQKRGNYESWVIQSNDFVMRTNISHKDGYHGSFKIFMTNNLAGQLINTKGEFTVSPEHLKITGVSNDDGAYNLEAFLGSSPYISKIEYSSNDQKFIDLNLSPVHEKTIEGQIHYSFIQLLLGQNFKRLILGRKNIMHMTLNQSNLETLTGSLSLAAGKFYIPESRNLIEHFSTDFNIYPMAKKLTFNNTHFEFCKGSLNSPQITLVFDEEYSLTQLHAPLEINNLFINWKKDFYGFIYGNILLNKKPTKITELTGNLVLKKSLLRDNIFSTEVNNNVYSLNNFFTNNINANVRISSEKPIKVKTSSIETYAHVDIKAKCSDTKEAVQIPYIEGTITLDGGSLNFFRNKLLIEYGRIQFVANQMNDPFIDLIARNTINKYVVTLQATGSLQKPNIILESTPDLNEEQILGLLLAGSENATLQADLPIMLMQNLNNIILGSKQLLPGSTSFFEKISRPLKYVQITPDFTDQSGRGGIKGILSINLSKQIHAQIQKNFNLQEDFGFQVEYLLSDDINLKVVKDPRGEVGSEIEVKFKL